MTSARGRRDRATGGHGARRLRTIGIVLVAVSMVLAGCSGGENPLAGGDGAGDGGAIDDDGVAEGGTADGGSSDWCRAGESYAYANPQTGEQTSLEIQGLTTYEGQEVCEATWTTSEGEVQRMVLYFTEDDSYTKVLMYDGDGNVVAEYGASAGGTDGAIGDGTDGAGDDGAGSDGSGTDGSSSFCAAGDSTQFANPQTGEQVSLEVQGMVTRDGREVCKATWTTNQGDVQRIEMFFDEEGSYQQVVMYDGDGNVVAEYGSSS